MESAGGSVTAVARRAEFQPPALSFHHPIKMPSKQPKGQEQQILSVVLYKNNVCRHCKKYVNSIIKLKKKFIRNKGVNTENLFYNSQHKPIDIEASYIFNDDIFSFFFQP